MRLIRRPWLWPVVAGLVLRIGWLVATVHPPHAEPLLADPAVYMYMADHAYHGRWLTGFLGEPTSFLSVGYPALLAIVRHISFGLLSSWGAALLVNLVASVALIIGAGRLAGLVADRVGLTPPRRAGAALLAAWTMAVFPDAIVATGLVMTELVGAALLIWTLVPLAALLGDKRSTRQALLVGALLGVSVFVRPGWSVMVVLVPVVVAWWTRAWRNALLVLAVTAVVVAPALWNNMARVHAGFGLTSATWINVCDGALRTDGRFEARPECRLHFDFLPPPGEEEVTVRISEERARADIGDHPVRWLAAMPVRLYRAFEFGGWGVIVSRDWSQHLPAGHVAATALRLSQAASLIVSVAGLAGLIVAIRRRQALWWLIVTVTIGTLTGVVITFGQPRYGWPTMAALLLPYAAVFVAKSEAAGAMWHRLTGRGEKI